MLRGMHGVRRVVVRGGEVIIRQARVGRYLSRLPSQKSLAQSLECTKRPMQTREGTGTGFLDDN
jgi:hypothetical protein